MAQYMPGESQIYHIELNTLKDCLNGECPFHFSEGNFAVSLNGRQYPVRVLRPYKTNSPAASRFQTHMLVVFPPGTPRPSDATVVKSLKRVLPRGWLVSVSRSDGSFTPFSSAATLTAALAATSAVPLNAERAVVAAQSVIETLEKFPGRRLLLDVAGAHNKPSPQWTSLETGTHVQVYIVDGGTKKMVYYDESWGAATRWPSPAGGDYLSKRARFYESGVFHEVKLDTAVKDILADTRYNYDLSFAIPASQTDPASPITLTLRNATGLLPYDAKAELYTVAIQTVDGKPLAIRTTPPQKLLVEGWWK